MFYICSYTTFRTCVNRFFRFIFLTSLITAFSSVHAWGYNPLKIGKFDYHYRVFVGGFEVAELKTHYSITDNSYDIAAEMIGVGFLKSLLDVEGEYATSGIINAQRILPKKFTTDATWRGNRTQGNVEFIANAEPKFSYIPEKGGFETEKYAEDVLKNTIDPASVSLILANQIQNFNHCNFEQKLFTGRHRIDIQSSDKGIKSLPENDVVGDIKNVRLCSVSATKIRPTDKPKDDKPIKINVYMVHADHNANPYPILLDSTYKSINAKVWMSELNHRS